MIELNKTAVEQVVGRSFSSGEAAGEQVGANLEKAVSVNAFIYNALKLLSVF